MCSLSYSITCSEIKYTNSAEVVYVVKVILNSKITHSLHKGMRMFLEIPSNVQYFKIIFRNTNFHVDKNLKRNVGIFDKNRPNKLQLFQRN